VSVQKWNYCPWLETQARILLWSPSCLACDSHTMSVLQQHEEHKVDRAYVWTLEFLLLSAHLCSVSGQRVLSLMNVKTALQLYVPVSGQRVLGQCKQ